MKIKHVKIYVHNRLAHVEETRKPTPEPVQTLPQQQILVDYYDSDRKRILKRIALCRFSKQLIRMVYAVEITLGQNTKGL